MLDTLVESSGPRINAALMEDTKILLPPEEVVDTGINEKDTLFFPGGFSLNVRLRALMVTSIRSVCFTLGAVLVRIWADETLS